MRKHKKIYIGIFIISFLIVINFLYYNKKENIHNATVIELDSIKEIGEVLSNRIFVYVQNNNVNTVDESKEHIEYLGDIRVKELKKKYN